jgi:hypothetical protein
MPDRITVYFVGDNEPVAMWASDWRSAARHPAEWRDDRPWSDDEVAAYRAAAPQRAAAEREKAMQEYLLGQSGVGSALACYERANALRHEAALQAEQQRRLVAHVRK